MTVTITAYSDNGYFVAADPSESFYVFSCNPTLATIGDEIVIRGQSVGKEAVQNITTGKTIEIDLKLVAKSHQNAVKVISILAGNSEVKTARR